MIVQAEGSPGGAPLNWAVCPDQPLKMGGALLWPAEVDSDILDAASLAHIGKESPR
jgi:hypothetical protein